MHTIPIIVSKLSFRKRAEAENKRRRKKLQAIRCKSLYSHLNTRMMRQFLRLETSSNQQNDKSYQVFKSRINEENNRI